MRKKLNADLVIALAAMLTAVVAVIVAVVQTNIMRQEAENEREHVRLSVMPSIGLYYSNGHEEDGAPFIQINIVNEGLGPAIIEDFSILYKGDKMQHQRHWVETIAGGREKIEQLAPAPQINNSYAGKGKIVPAGGTLNPIYVSHESLSLAVGDALKDTKFEICVCSFYGDCQRLLHLGPMPEPVATCENYQTADVLENRFR